MSNNDSLDELTRKYLAKSDDLGELEVKDTKNKAKTWKEKDDNGNEVEKNDRETPDSEW